MYGITLEINQRCNLQCEYCYLKEKNNSAMLMETAIRSIDHAFDNVRIHKDKKLVFDFVGGEALLDFELLKKIVEYIESVNKVYSYTVIYGLTTNGTLFTNDIVDWLARYNFNLKLSIDGDRQVTNMGRKMKNAEDYVKSVKLDLFSDQVFAFTPNGDVLDLPKNATPVDFSYRIHSDVGHKTVGALINGRIVPLNTKIKNGDIVEILTSKTPAPRLDWLTFVVTKQAAQKIRQWFKKNNREEHVKLGKSNLEHELTKAVFDDYVKQGEFDKVAKIMNYQSAEDLFAALGYGETTLSKIINKLKKPQEKKPEDNFHTSNRKSSNKDIEGLEGLMYSFAMCCSPIPGEPIVGVVTRSKGVSVHRIDCKTLETIPHERLMNIKWAGINTNKTYNTTIRIETAEKLGLLKDVISAVSDNNANIVNATIKTKNHVGIIEIGLELDNIDTLKKVIACIQSLPDVFSVKRIQTSSSMLKKSSPQKTQKNYKHKRNDKNSEGK